MLLAADAVLRDVGPRHRGRFVTSSGDDEAAQRADAVAIKAEKPFAVIDLVPNGLDVLDAELARRRSSSAAPRPLPQKALAQAPYRWGRPTRRRLRSTRPKSSASSSSARRRSSPVATIVKTQTAQVRRGLHRQRHRHRRSSRAICKKYRWHARVREQLPAATARRSGERTSRRSRPRSSSTKMKSAGVTTVILFTDSR